MVCGTRAGLVKSLGRASRLPDLWLLGRAGVTNDGHLVTCGPKAVVQQSASRPRLGTVSRYVKASWMAAVPATHGDTERERSDERIETAPRARLELPGSAYE